MTGKIEGTALLALDTSQGIANHKDTEDEVGSMSLCQSRRAVVVLESRLHSHFQKPTSGGKRERRRVDERYKQVSRKGERG